MSRRDDEFEKRPERVIIVDADDPMTEIHGRFVWQEEHDRVVEEVRRQAFADGYSTGSRDASAEEPATMQVGLRRRRTFASRIRLGLLILAAVCLFLALPIILSS